VALQPTPDELISWTRENPYDRFEDGRPRVPDDMLARLRAVTTEQAWRVLKDHGYAFQFEGNWKETHPEQVIVGRAVTAAFLPLRPDYHEAVQHDGIAEGRGTSGKQNSWVIDLLGPNDVMVVDIFGKVRDGTVVGDNLATAVATRTGVGAVIDGGIRDYQGVRELPGVNFFMRGIDPTAIDEVTLTSINRPVKIGQATVLPGDAVLGTPTGVIFIPPHLVAEVVVFGEETAARDIFGKRRLHEGRYTSGQIDVSVWSAEIEGDYLAWREANDALPADRTAR
jgi:4-hydroxy-4-methyl-2-oxoglutarate aldolase